MSPAKPFSQLQPHLLALMQAIKLWAEVRGVYSNVSGYLGGVNMALMVGRICKWYPAKSAANIVHNFFMVSILSEHLMRPRGW
jgi:poly(A) polymerase Pap1